jgi:bacillithiol biosynthesis deacetylase BshB1
MGKRVGIVDLTRGEMGTRGTPEIRDEEAKKAAEILGCSVRLNLEMPDGLLENSHDNHLLVAAVIRKYRPEIVIMNAPTDRHPDHGIASQMVEEACFKAGLHKVHIYDGEVELLPWRPKQMYKYLQFYNINPDIIVDISDSYNEKMDSILAHKSQFYNPNSNEPQTVIASKSFLDSVSARSMDWGRIIGVQHAEPLIVVRHAGVKDLTNLL